MWRKMGLVFDVDEHKNDLLCSHASIPFAYQIEKDRYRIFFSSRNREGKSLPYYIDAIVKDGIIELNSTVSEPLLGFGPIGSFDDSGIMPSCFVKSEHGLFMYYIGWNPQVTVSYRLSIGLAVSYDNGMTFQKHSLGPICDRDKNEPFFNTAPYVIKENDNWHMWYISCTGWEIIDDYPEPAYHIKYAKSTDGINWEKNNIVCLDYDDHAKALGRPSVRKVNGRYEMYFSYRNTHKYRTSALDGYKLGFAVSDNKVDWEKKYDETGISLSKTGWDSQMMEYCHVFHHDGIDYMLYNGNGFGKQGFGYAVR